MRRMTSLVGAAAAAVAWALVAPAGPVEAGKPGGGGGGGTTPAGQIVYVAADATQSLWGTDAAGTQASCLYVNVGAGRPAPAMRWFGDAVRRDGKVWALGVRDPGNGDLELVAIQERTSATAPVVESVLATESADGLTLDWAGPRFLAGSGSVSLGGVLDGTSGVFSAALQWGADGRPALASGWNLEFSWPSVPLYAELSAGRDRVVFADYEAATATWRLLGLQRDAQGAWGTTTPRTFASGVAAAVRERIRLSPDGARVLLDLSGGIRVVGFDGSGETLLVADRPSSGVDNDHPVWSPDSQSLAYRVNKTSRNGTGSTDLYWTRATGGSGTLVSLSARLYETGCWLP